MDTPKHGSPLPQLPVDLDDPAALDRWYCEWNAWIANEAAKRNWPWLKPMTPAMLHEIVEREKKRRSNTAHGTPQEELSAARGDLNALEAHLRATDSQYEAKRTLLVPILQPIFKHILPSNWSELFEQAYARTQVPVGSPTQDQQRELAEGRNALTALENRLRVQDPAYETKKALLVPILKPVFMQLPPSKWAAAFEQAYEQTRVPADDRTSATSRVEIRDKIFEEFDASTSSDQRSALLAAFKATMDIVESHLAKNGTEQQLAEFREARADDYTKLVVKESTVDGTREGTISPEAFMAVTNREIAAGRMTPDDPIRQLAVKAAAAPHLSHAESLAQEEAKKRSDAAIQSLANELTSAKNFNVADARAKIQKAWAATTTSDQRGRVLAIFKVVMDEAEQRLVGQGDDKAELLADFQKARVQDYNLFILEECTVGLDTPVVGGDVSVDMLMSVTNREIAAGRMTEDHAMRKHAVKLAAAPHFSHAELVAKHAKLKEEAAKAKAAPVPQTFGQKIKGLLGVV